MQQVEFAQLALVKLLDLFLAINALVSVEDASFRFLLQFWQSFIILIPRSFGGSRNNVRMHMILQVLSITASSFSDLYRFVILCTIAFPKVWQSY